MKITGIRNMSDRHRVLFLILILAVVVFFTTAVTNYFLYNAALEQNRERLVVTISSQARLIEAIASHEVEIDKEMAGFSDALALVTEFHDNFEEFGETGEFTLARRVKDQIVFLFHQRHPDFETPKPVPFDSEWAEPMRQALLGHSGTLAGLDYRGETVLAAYEPVEMLNIGIVAKIDMAEIRAPFIETGIITVLLALAGIIAGAFLFVRTTTPMFTRIQQSEEKFRNLFEHANDSIFILDPSTRRFIDVNENASKRLGYTKEELLRKNADDLYPPNEAEKIPEIIQKMITAGSAIFESIHLRKDNTELAVEVSSRVIQYGGNQVFQSFARDITERKRAEEDLALVRNTLDLTLDPIFLFDPNTLLFLYFNQGAMEQLGYSREELMKLSAVDIKPEFTVSSFRQLIAPLQEGEQKSVTFETYHRTKSGKDVPVECFLQYITPHGERPRFLTIVRDITDRKRAEEELRQSEERYRKIFENSNDAIFVIDPMADRILGVNLKASSMLGYSQEELLTLRMSAIHPDDMPKMMAFAESVFEKGHGWTDELSCRTRWGTTLSIEMSASVMETDGRDSLVARVRDTTVRKQLESQFQQAQKMEAVGTLAGGIAHNFNNLLQMIMGSTSELLMKTDSSDPDYNTLHTIVGNIRSGSELTRQLLGFARGGKYEVKLINLNTLLANVTSFVSRSHREIELHQELEAALWNTEADQGQIEQVLLNLFVNACEAMPRGGQVLVGSKNVIIDDNFAKLHDVEPGRYIKLSVADTGSGMDPATVARIFEPFFTTKEVGQGSGLGLASAYGIVKNHDGIITVESDVQKGTTFDIYLPATEKEIVKIEGATKGDPEGTGTILFVDDEMAIIAACQRGLKSLGYSILAASSGIEAVKVYETNAERIDLVILDMIMPGMGGGAVFDKLKELNPMVKVLLTSGYSIDGQATEIMDRGCDGFIQKPFDLDMLSEKIHEVLDQGVKAGPNVRRVAVE